MKRILFLALFLTISAHASDKLGLGLALGTPIGIHYTYDMPKTKRLEGAIGSIHNGQTSFDAHYVETMKDRFHLQAYNLDFNWGPGVRVVTGRRPKLGPSVLAGVDHNIDNTNFSLLANSGASLLFGDGLSLNVNLYIGANYHF
jgi:hypothetical protein